MIYNNKNVRKCGFSPSFNGEILRCAYTGFFKKLGFPISEKINNKINYLKATPKKGKQRTYFIMAGGASG